MVAAAFLYSHLVPVDYDGEPYFALNAGAAVTWALVAIAAGWVTAYFIWMKHGARKQNQQLHPAETWIVLSHALAFGSAYFLGATRASFLLWRESRDRPKECGTARSKTPFPRCGWPHPSPYGP